MSNTLIATVGIDLGKSTFHLVGFDEHGAIRLRQKMSRSQLERRFANLRPCLVGMEACAGAHHVARRLAAYGHDARLIPAKYVKPFLKGHKNDYRDAEAIAEAVGRPTMRFVPLKSVEQLDLQALHRVRSRRDAVELIQHRLVEALADAVIRYVSRGALSSAVPRGEERYGEPIWDAGHREHERAGRPSIDSGL